MDLEFRNELRAANDRNWDRVRSELDLLGAVLTAEVRSGLADLRTELRTDRASRQIAHAFAEVRADIRAAFREQRRWMFFFWATTELALVAADIL